MHRHLKHASFLLFTLTAHAIAGYDPNVLPNGREYFELRDGLANCRIKFDQEKTGRVAFLGGSITAGGGWRDYACISSVAELNFALPPIALTNEPHC